jgi:hypothetical protein
MPDGSVHRELLLPPPSREPPPILPLDWCSGAPFWIEVHRHGTGRVRYVVGTVAQVELDSLLTTIETFPPRAVREGGSGDRQDSNAVNALEGEISPDAISVATVTLDRVSD